MTVTIILSIVGCIGMAAVGISQVYNGVSGAVKEIKKAKEETKEEKVEEEA